VSLAAFRVTEVLMRRYTGVRAATNSVENVDFPGAEVFKMAEGGNDVTVFKGEVMLYLAV
jgi:hypothetical protein